jgi:hypothetical protein
MTTKHGRPRSARPGERIAKLAEPTPGDPWPLGAGVSDAGVNFSVFARSSTAVELLLFDSADDARPANAWREELEFQVPEPPAEARNGWVRWLDTALATPGDVLPLSEAPVVAARSYRLPAHSLAVLVGVLAGPPPGP